MIVRTDAVVLHSFDYGETSRIVRLLTRSHGVVGVLARGARRPTSAFGSTLQPLSYLQAVYYHRPNRGLQTLKEAAHVVRFKRLTGEVSRVTLGLRVLEVTRAQIQEGEAHPLALDLVVRTLEHIDEAEANAANAVPWFQLHLASLLGFDPDVRREDVEALTDDGGRLLLQSGTVVPAGEPKVLADGARQRAVALTPEARDHSLRHPAMEQQPPRQTGLLVDQRPKLLMAKVVGDASPLVGPSHLVHQVAAQQTVEGRHRLFLLPPTRLLKRAKVEGAPDDRGRVE